MLKREITRFARKTNLHLDFWLFHATSELNWNHMGRCPLLTPAPLLSLVSLRNLESDKKGSPQEQVGHIHPDSPWHAGWTSCVSKNQFTHSARHKNLPVVHNLFIATTAVRAQVFLATRKAQSELQPSVWGLGNLSLCQLLNFKESRVILFSSLKAPPEPRFKCLTVTFPKCLSDLGAQVTVISCRHCGEDWPLTNS